MTVHDYDKEIKIHICGYEYEKNKIIENAFVYHIKKEIYNFRLRLIKTNYAVKTVTDYNKNRFNYDEYYLDMFATAICGYELSLEYVLFSFELHKRTRIHIPVDIRVTDFSIKIYPPNMERKLKIKQLGLI
jgi:hypothetical protein